MLSISVCLGYARLRCAAEELDPVASRLRLRNRSVMAGGWVYIVANRRDGVIYVGVTSDIRRRAYEHREGLIEGFSKRYGCKRLVHAEPYETITEAIRREKTLKRWSRAWKVRLIHTANPEWEDLYDTLAIV